MNQDKAEVVRKYRFFRDCARTLFKVYLKEGGDELLREAWRWQLGWSYIIRVNGIRDFCAHRKSLCERWEKIKRK